MLFIGSPSNLFLRLNKMRNFCGIYFCDWKNLGTLGPKSQKFVPQKLIPQHFMPANINALNVFRFCCHFIWSILLVIKTDLWKP